ncbi:MAG: TonB-dependent receptor plug domain-containing protein [Desulfobacterales bacterium]|nr:TonB-dependent receptor plug domain-containing protein [Desulfobacterales bacterium]
MKKDRRAIHPIGIAILLIGAALMVWTSLGMAADAREQEVAQKQEEVQQLKDVVVTEKGGAPGLEQSPSKTVINVEDFTVIGAPGNIEDLFKTQAIIDFRGETDLVPDSDTLNMRGFSSGRFVMAVDGLTVQKTGGRKGTHIVDYTLLSPLPIEKIEIIAGPHCALYDSKSIGGAINIVTEAPKRRDSLKPDVKLSTSYSSYNTQNHSLRMQGAADIVTYGLGVQLNSTDGYLRHNETDIQTYSGNIGALLPYNGFINLSASRSNVNREVPVNNTGDDYDSDYPEVEGASFDAYQDPTWDKNAWSYRLNYLQNLPIGRLTVAAYRSEEDRDRAYYTWINSSDHSEGLELSSMFTTWRQEGGKIQDEYKWTDNHISTFGYETAKLYDGEDEDERVRKVAGYLQHQWNITSFLDVKLGLRHEDVKIWVSNSQTSGIPNRGSWIEREWHQWVPKSYTTWKMDAMTPWLRDTSLSLGISKIWHAPDSHGEYNPQGRPTGAWLEPEHGMGYDFVLNRRLWRDISLMLDYSFYNIKDFIASNSSYAEYSGASAGDLRYSDYKINLEEVHRQGVELNLGGHLTMDLSFYLTYAWQNFKSQGDEPAGKTELDDQAEHRISAGLRYSLFEKTALMLDYYYQSKEVSERSELIGYDENNEEIYDWSQVDNPSYQLVNFALEQKLFKNKWFFRDAKLKFYIKNLFDEVYYDSRAYPSTDRTYGVTFSVGI